MIGSVFKNTSMWGDGGGYFLKTEKITNVLGKFCDTALLIKYFQNIFHHKQYKFPSFKTKPLTTFAKFS